MGQQPETSCPVVLKTAQIASISLHAYRPLWTRFYALSFTLLYLALAGAYFIGIIFEKRTLVLVGANIVGAHALTFLLITRWSIVARARVTCRPVKRLEDADCILVRPLPEHGRAKVVRIEQNGSPLPQDWIFRFNYQRYAVWTLSPLTFVPVICPCDSAPPLDVFLHAGGDPSKLRAWYGPNTLDVPVPPVSTLFAKSALAPLFVLQTLCAALWIADGYMGWPLCIMLAKLEYTYEQAESLHTLTLSALRALGCPPYAIETLRDGGWKWVRTEALFPGDIVTVTAGRVVPADMLLSSGSVVVDAKGGGGNDVPPIAPPTMLLAGSTVIECTSTADTPDARVRATVVRTGFGTQLGQSVRDALLRAGSARDAPPATVPRTTTAFILSFAVAMSAAFWDTAATASRRLPVALECALVFVTAFAFRDDAANLVTPLLQSTKSMTEDTKQHHTAVLDDSARPRARAWMWSVRAGTAALYARVAYHGALQDGYWEGTGAAAIALRVLFLWFLAFYNTANARELDDTATADAEVAPARAGDAQVKRPDQERVSEKHSPASAAEISGSGPGEGDEKRVP